MNDSGKILTIAGVGILALLLLRPRVAYAGTGINPYAQQYGAMNGLFSGIGSLIGGFGRSSGYGSYSGGSGSSMTYEEAKRRDFIESGGYDGYGGGLSTGGGGDWVDDHLSWLD